MLTIPAPQPIRARTPVATGIVERDGGRIAYEVFGAGDQSMTSVPPWQIVHARIVCATLVIQADRHLITHELAKAIPGARLESLEGSGHVPNARDPVLLNFLIRDFVGRLWAASWS